MRIKIFKDPEKYKELLQLLNEHLSYCAIARHFHCDRTSIMYHARKVGIMPRERLYIPMPPVRPEVEEKIYIDPRHIVLRVEKINLGKNSYAEYVQETRERNTKRIIVNGLIF